MSLRLPSSHCRRASAPSRYCYTGNVCVELGFASRREILISMGASRLVLDSELHRNSRFARRVFSTV
eukprot:4915225-Pleurochrysis_carterae.AAC.1